MYGQNNNTALQIQMQQLQGMMGQLQAMMQANASYPGSEQQQPQKQIEQTDRIQYVHGIEEARAEQRKLANGGAKILMDDGDSVFYAVKKDENGRPQKIAVCRFTVEEEPEPPKYVTQDDLAAFKADIISAIKGEKT